MQPIFKPRSIEELRKEREELTLLFPYPLEVLQRLRAENALNLEEEERLLDRHDDLTWLIKD
ncbi:hypothetical protein VVR26_10010 [Corynebacterium camporealensis]|uniref:hypothetical protein n=1 Tax=Corynebacterium camporealensis TaxID=161896 RepID=UPI0034CDD73F